MLNLTDVNDTPAARPPLRWPRWTGVLRLRQPPVATAAPTDPNIIAMAPYLVRHPNSRVRRGVKNGNR